MSLPRQLARVWVLGATWGAVALGCGNPPARLPPGPLRAPSTLVDWAIAGCQRLRYRSARMADPAYPAVCARNVDVPTVFVRAPPGALVVATRERPPARVEAVLSADEDAPTHVLRLEGDGRWTIEQLSAGERVEIEVRPFVRRPPTAALRLLDVHEARATSAVREARGLLAAADLRAELLDVHRAADRAFLAHRAGQLLLADHRADEAAVAYELAGFLYLRAGDARGLLASTYERTRSPPHWLEGQWLFHKRRSFTALRYLWRPDRALEAARAALEVAEQIDHSPYRARSLALVLDARSQAGRGVDLEAARALLDRLESESLAACTRKQILVGLGWVRFLAAIDGGGRALEGLPSATQLIERALPVDACGGAFDVWEPHLNLALAAGEEGRRDVLRRARRWLRAAGDERSGPWLDLVDALAAPDAKARIARLQSFRSDDPGAEWFRLRLLARWLEPTDRAGALRALEAAVELAARPSAGAEAGRRAWMLRRAGEALVELLLEAGRVDAAYEAARRHVRIELRPVLTRWLGERLEAGGTNGVESAATRLVPDLLAGPPREVGVARLLVGRFRGRVLAFLDDGEVHVAPLAGEPEGTAAVEAALAAHAPRLGGVRSLSVVWTRAVAGARLAAVSAPGEEGPLLRELPVAWTLDLPKRATSGRRSAEEEPRPGITTGVDLGALSASERSRASRVAGAGRAASGPEVFLADRAAIVVGHGSFSLGDPRGGWIQLGDARITAADVVGLSGVAPSVGLFACAGAGSSQGPARWDDRSLGVAHALLLAGAEAVVASTEELSESVALDFAEAWLREVRAGRSSGEGFRGAWLQLWAAGTREVASIDLWTRS